MKQPFTRLFGLVDKEDKSLDQVKHISVEIIEPSPYQPRTVFQEDRIDELCQSIRSHGVIQPIVVRRNGHGGYELIAGERRLRAVRKLGMETVPAIIRNMTDNQAASAALIENLQRENLTAIEEAHAYQRLLELNQLTQESLAQRLGKGQSTIANKLRLLHLPEEVQTALLKRSITERHARALLSLKDEALQLQVLADIIEHDLNVKHTEKTKKSRRKSVSRDLRIAINTIRQSVDMVKQSGLLVQADEQEHDEFYEVIIRIPKQGD
jgi:ParB family chromosome partitioning protein